MTRDKAIEFVRSLRNKGKTYTAIAAMLPAEWKGTREPGTLQRWLNVPPSDLPGAKSKNRSPVVKTKLRRASVKITPTEVSGPGKVIILMCSMQQARELLG